MGRSTMPPIGAAILITAQERASEVFRKIGGEAGKLSGHLVKTGATAAIVGTNFSKLNLALTGIIPAIVALAAGATAVKWAQFEAATRRASFAMALSGLSAREAQIRINMVNSALTRASAEGFFNFGGAVSGAIELDRDLFQSLLDISGALEDKIRIPASESFAAMAEAIKGNNEPLDELLGRIGAVVGPVTTVEEKFAAIKGTLGTLSVTRVDALLTALGSLKESTETTVGELGNVFSGFFVVFVGTLASFIINVKDNPQLILAFATLGAFLIDKGAIFGKGFVGALVGAAIAGLSLDLGSSIKGVLEDPEVLLVIGIAAGTLGRYMGSKWLVPGIVAAIGFELVPGISTALGDAGMSDVLTAAAWGLGIIVGKKIGGTKGVLAGLALASTLTDSINVLYNGNSISDPALELAIIGLGAAIGFVLGGWVGLTIGAAMANALIQAEKEGNLPSWVRFFIDPKYDKEIRDTLKDWAMKWGGVILDGIKDPLKTFGKIFSDIFSSEGVADILRRAKEFGVSVGNMILDGIKSALGWFLNFIFPYSRTASTSAVPVPEMTHASLTNDIGGGIGSRISGMPLGGTIVVQLVLDRYVLGEAVVDIIDRTARFKAGLTEASVATA